MEAVMNTNSTSVNTVDAIWNLIQSQSVSVRKALAKRMIEAEEKRKTLHQQEMVEETLGRALEEVRESERTGKALMSFDDFLKEVNS